MELQEQVVHRVQAKTDRFRWWLKFFGHPMIMCPGIVAGGLSPCWALKLGGTLGCTVWTVGLVSLLCYAYTRSMRPYDAANGVFWHPAWTAFCLAVQGHKVFRYEHLHMKPMRPENEAWLTLIRKQSHAYDCLAHPHEIKTKEDWIALRTIEYLFKEGEKTLLWEE